MGDTKRRRSRSPTSSRKSFKLDDDEDIEAILEKIRQQEESEALVIQLQRDFEASLAAEMVDLTGDDGVGDLDDHYEVIAASAVTGPSTCEDDAAMARRLAREWAELDAVATSTNVAGHQDTNSASWNLSSSSQPMNGITPVHFANCAPPVVNPQSDLLTFRDMFTQSRECTKCGENVTSPRNMVVYSAKSIPPPTLLALLHCVCEACGQSHCRGCFRALACARNCRAKRCSVAICCAEVRAIGLFEALGGFDRLYLAQRVGFSDKNCRPLDHRKVATVGPGGTGYSTEPRHHHSRNSRSEDDSAHLADQRAADASKAVAAKWDDVVLRTLDTITWLLPAPYSDAAASYDLLPHRSIRSLISLSYLPELLGGLLINDSVTDWTDRSDVYNSMLRLLRRMTDSELSVGALIEERLERRMSVGLEGWMWGDGTIEWERNPKTHDIIRAPPLFDRFKKLTKQCETFLAGASHLLIDGGDSLVEDMVVKATSLCRDMISAQQDMQRALSVMVHGNSVAEDVSIGKGKGRDGNVDMEKRYCAACEKLAFKHVSLFNSAISGSLSYSAHHFSQTILQSENSTRQPSKRLHLIRELSVISTSLPPGVWVRVDEIRNDVIKIMIAGPEGTPYAGGLFEFDCFLPIEYPDVSPKMNLCTTASGKVRFNPNLYADGKVCLSLLGTWPGRPEEQWSSKSTLLQVIISIQSMILVDAPFFNEPGYGQAKLDDPRSISYNKNIALQTVRWAMVDWMQEKHRNTVWADVIANHFSIRHKNIEKCIRTWARDDARFHKYNSSSMKNAGSGIIEPPHIDRKYMGHFAAADLETKNLLVDFDRGCNLVQTWLEYLK